MIRTYDLRVMSPARSLCATPVKWGDRFCKATEEGASSAHYAVLKPLCTVGV